MITTRGVVCSSLCFIFESNFWSSTSSSDLPVWQFLPHALWSSDLTGKRLGEENPAFWVLTTMLLCLKSGSQSTLASALCKLWVWDVDLEAQMSVYVFILYFLSTKMILSSIFSLLLKKWVNKKRVHYRKMPFYGFWLLILYVGPSHIRKGKKSFSTFQECTKSLVNLRALIKRGYCASQLL